jgi:hypothetical protein
MAHFLSDATHRRLGMRDDVILNQGDEDVDAAGFHDDPMSHVNTQSAAANDEALAAHGVTKTHSFNSAMRCVAVTPHDARLQAAAAATKAGAQGMSVANNKKPPMATPMPTLQLWSGDMDGSVTARQGLAGCPIRNIDKKAGVFAFAMHCFDPYMWVGFSDGYVCVYEVATTTKVFETRAHTASVNCIMSVGTDVFTAGSDWQIVRWDALTFHRVPHGQFSGHQNAVRCMVSNVGDDRTGSNGGEMLLFSGGDDYAIRCWDLDTGFEKSAPWPVISHRGGVHALVLHHVYLFSSSEDGTVKVWNTQTAQLARVLEDRGPGVAVNCLLADESNATVWAGATDGILRLWDAATLSLVGEIVDHKNTSVAMVKPVARAVASKLWTVDASGAISVLFCDPDGATAANGEGGYEALRNLDMELQQTIDERRDTLLSNYRALEAHRDHRQRLHDDELKKKKRLAATLGKTHGFALCVAQQETVVAWVERRRVQRIRDHTVETMAAARDTTLMSRYLAAYVSFAAKRAVQRHKAKVTDFLVGEHDAALRGAYVKSIAEFTRREKRAKQRVMLCEKLQLHNETMMMRVVYKRWERRLAASKFAAKRQPLAAVLNRQQQLSTVRHAWDKLETMVLRERRTASRAATLAALSGMASDALLRRYYTILAAAKKQRLIAVRRNALASTMEMHVQHGVRAEIFQFWMTRSMLRNREKMRQERAAQVAKLDAMTKMLEHSAHDNADDLEDMLRAKQMELVVLLAETDETKLRQAALARQKRELQRELSKTVSLDNGDPPMAQLTEAMYLLKARGVNVREDVKEIEQAREACNKTSPEAVYDAGLQTVRSVCASVIRPDKLLEPGQPDWYIGELFALMTQRHVVKASAGLVQMITAWDMLNMQQCAATWITKAAHRDPAAAAGAPKEQHEGWAPKYKHNEEVIVNFGTMLELATRIYRVHRHENLVSGEPLTPRSPSKRRGREASPSGEMKKKTTRSASKGKDATKKLAPPPKRAASKPPGKTAKKATSKSPSAKKTTSKSPAAKKTTSKSPAAKKSTSKSPAPKKTTSKSPAPKKTTSKSPGSKKTTSKSPSPGAKKSSSTGKKKSTSVKAASKSPSPQAPADEAPSSPEAAPPSQPPSQRRDTMVMDAQE